VATARYLTALFVAGTAAALLAACGGSQGSMTPQASSPVSPMVKHHCTAEGGVRVTPCSVDLTVSNPGPDTVVVRTPQRKKGTLSETDTCGGASGIATVTQNPSNADQWIVTAGAMTGSCTATFNFASGKNGKIVGFADLAITNSI
jgi:hypothetical protein